MSFISWTENGDLVITMRDDGVSRNIGTFLVEVKNGNSLPAQFIIPSAKNWVTDYRVVYTDEDVEILTVEFVLRDIAPVGGVERPTGISVTPFYSLSTDVHGRPISITIPYPSRIINVPEILEEIKGYRVATVPNEVHEGESKTNEPTPSGEVVPLVEEGD